MSTMRRKHSHKYLAVDTIIQKLISKVAAMAVNNEELLVLTVACFFLGVAVEHLLQPRQSYVIVRLSRWC
jgi:hypothetical protein